MHPQTPLEDETDNKATSLAEWATIFGLEGKAVLTLEEAANVLRISERSLRDHVKCGDIPSLRLGRRVLIPVPMLLKILADLPETA